MALRWTCIFLTLVATGCEHGSSAATGIAALVPALAAGQAPAPRAADFAVTEVARFDEPWAMAFLPDGRLLVTEKKGALKLLAPGAPAVAIAGVPAVSYGGQGGFGDIVVHPKFASNRLVYFSYVEKGAGNTRGAVVARARLELRAGGGTLAGTTVIWRQHPKVEGGGHFGHRIAFGPGGKLWISSGERQQFDPAQDLAGNLGKILRLNDDGSVPRDNPFAARGGVAAQVWTLGHRNPLGLAFDGQGRLWEIEMGPKGGDELNLIARGRNYGWPKVSNGDNYDGSPIPDHATAPQYEAPKLSWTPVIAPGDLIIYDGAEFPQWRGQVLIAGLASQALVRVQLQGDSAREIARYDMGRRIREVEQGPDGAVWLLEDGADARLLKLTRPAPAR
jgi:glucose/arabinose dehydrogenase